MASKVLEYIRPEIERYKQLADEMFRRWSLSPLGQQKGLDPPSLTGLIGTRRCTFCGQQVAPPNLWANELRAEWHNQANLRDQGKFPFASFDGEAPFEHMLTVLVEEVGETAEATLALRTQDQPSELAQELLQVAAIALGWRERVLRRGSPI